jgi:hypothetical protein
MKKLILALVLFVGLISCQRVSAQTSAEITMTAATTGKDSILNAGTTTFKTGKLSKFSSGNYRFYFTAANVSGTSTFKVLVKGSMNGVKWFPLTKVPGTDGNNCDTLQCTSVTTADQFTMTSLPGCAKYTYALTQWNTGGRVLYLALDFVGTGTQVTRITDPKVLPFDK